MVDKVFSTNSTTRVVSRCFFALQDWVEWQVNFVPKLTFDFTLSRDYLTHFNDHQTFLALAFL
jgi:hypothetical protein